LDRFTALRLQVLSISQGREEIKVTLKDAADLATALTLIVATVTFVLALSEHRKREQEKRVQNWQRVVVYKIINDGVADFDQIKIRYVTEAQQISTFKLPKEEIQDDALQLALMTLISDHLISKSADADSAYLVNAASQHENQIKSLAMGQIQRQMSQNRILSKLYETLEVNSGKYTIDQLYRMFEVEHMGYSFEDFDVLVRERMDRGVIVMNPQNQKLWLRALIPPKSQGQAASQGPQTTTQSPKQT
jgi:hypothetical protein